MARLRLVEDSYEVDDVTFDLDPSVQVDDVPAPVLSALLRALSLDAGSAWAIYLTAVKPPPGEGAIWHFAGSVLTADEDEFTFDIDVPVAGLPAEAFEREVDRLLAEDRNAVPD